MRRFDLVADCERCAALCCVALSFDASDDFAFSKAAGIPCPHLTTESRCSIHGELEQRGLRGCASFDCYGAGQRATRRYADRDRGPAFVELRLVHEMLWLLKEAARLSPRLAADPALEAAIEELDALGSGELTTLLAADLAARRRDVNALLRRAGDDVRRAASPRCGRAQASRDGSAGARSAACSRSAPAPAPRPSAPGRMARAAARREAWRS